MRCVISRWLAALASSLAICATAEPLPLPLPLPLEMFFRHADIGAVELSPSGTRLAVSLRVGERFGLGVIDVDGDPVLLLHAGQDRRVPIKHGEAMRDALRAAGNEPEWVVYPGEAHGWLKTENRYDFARRLGEFLTRHLDR